MICTPLLTGCDAGHGRGNSIAVLATQEALLRHCRLRIVISSGLNREDVIVEWAKYRSKNVCVRQRRRPVADWPHMGAFQMTAPEIIIAGPHCMCVWSGL